MKLTVHASLVFILGCGARAPRGPASVGNVGAAPAAGEDRAVEVLATPMGTCARMSDATVRCWGAGSLGERLTPVPVPGVTAAAQLFGSQGGTCARREDGQVQCWGAISFLTSGQDEAALPVPELAGAERVWMHADDGCARLRGGKLVCWGMGAGFLAAGRPGDHGTGPAPVVAALRDATDLALDERLGCARLPDGTVMCWGENDQGQVGDGTTTLRLAPVAVQGLAGAAQVVVGRDAACARLDDGTVSCWGGNTYGQLGDASMKSSAVPRPVANVRDVVELAGGASHTCARHRDGTVTCWGMNQHGQLGQGMRAEDGYLGGLPAKVKGLANVTQLSLGSEHSCALHGDGTISCWGANTFGLLGDGTQVWRTRPAKVQWRVEQRVSRGLPPGVRVKTIAIGAAHACAGLDDGSVRCWGWNEDGQATAVKSDPVTVPAAVPGLTRVATLRLDARSSEATREDGTVVAWGANRKGVETLASATPNDLCTHAADGTLTCSLQEQTATLRDTTAFATGVGAACGLRKDGTVHCMGVNYAGQLGDGTTHQRLTFAPVAGIAKVVQLVSAASLVCVRHADGKVSCWGGDPSRGMMFPSPVVVEGLGDAAELFAGDAGVCARRASGAVACWGWYAVQGDGAPSFDRITPEPVPWLQGARAIALGEAFGCAILGSGEVVCWGDNRSGQLGDGTFSARNKAVPVRW